MSQILMGLTFSSLFFIHTFQFPDELQENRIEPDNNSLDE